MKYIIVIVYSLFIFSCDDPELQNGLLGTWELKERYADPGDGSGDFEKVNSDKRITFSADSTVMSNGNLCRFDVDPSVPSRASFSVDRITVDCGFEFDYFIFYNLEGNVLTLSYPCIESCQERYEFVE